MAIIPDCSSILCLAFKGEDIVYGTSVLEEIQKDGGIVPPIFWYEIRNGLISNERCIPARITVADSNAFLGLLSQLPIVIDPLPSDAAVMEIARAHDLTSYDASYVELALRTGFPLASFDRKMKKASRAVGVSVWPAEC